MELSLEMISNNRIKARKKGYPFATESENLMTSLQVDSYGLFATQRRSLGRSLVLPFLAGGIVYLCFYLGFACFSTLIIGVTYLSKSVFDTRVLGSVYLEERSLMGYRLMNGGSEWVENQGGQKFDLRPSRGHVQPEGADKLGFVLSVRDQCTNTCLWSFCQTSDEIAWGEELV
ncbi:hypothetical protein Tco_0991966 [Tanacetum coccineum]|uniref:Uncharacterized protein n=1 Tax=Tanacetum coccineum TaxID=301880 RepID=A0ABQ5F136_9ASTR